MNSDQVGAAGAPLDATAGLLTLEEAARYLNVSKVSLRRWTNRGRLHCLRIGSRRERRFRVEDLARLLNESGESGPALRQRPLAPRHVGLYFRTLDEQWELFRPYFLDHVARALPVVYIYDDDRGGNVRRRIRGEGVDPAALARAGLLRLLPASQAYLRTGSFNAERMIDFMHSVILDMRACGHSAGMLTGETNWYTSGADGVAEFPEYERRLNDLLAGYPDITVVCHYDLCRMGGEVVLSSVHSHPTHCSQVA
jgi:excisionase family DNA binding protein